MGIGTGENMMRSNDVLKVLYSLTSEVGKKNAGLREIAREVSIEPYKDVMFPVYKKLRRLRSWELVKAKRVPVPGRGVKNLYSLTQNGVRRAEWHLARERSP